MNAQPIADAALHPFDAATALSWVGPGHAIGRTSPAFYFKA
jgi:hypothetical protein